MEDAQASRAGYLLWALVAGRRVSVKRLGRPLKAVPAPILPLRSLLLDKARFPFP